MPRTRSDRPDGPQGPTITDLTLSRRAVLQGGATVAAAVGLGVFATESGAIAVGLDGPHYLSAADLKLLSAVVDRVVPGQPEDLAVGAVQVGCPAAIDGLLAAFDSSTPRIFAGAPYSDRGGSPVNYFEEFLPLDPYEERAWRLRIEGDPASGVLGFQQVYTRGLAALAKSSPLFAVLPGAARDLVLRTTTDADIAAMRDQAVTHTIEFFLAAPEYGGNRDLGGWKAVAFDGDTQPRGFTDAEVDDPPLEPLPLLPMPPDNLVAGMVGGLLGGATTAVTGRLATLPTGPAGASASMSAPALALGTAEGMQSLGGAGTDHATLQEALGVLLDPLTDPGSPASSTLQQIHARAAELVAEAKK